jgi:hypothetical protein
MKAEELIYVYFAVYPGGNNQNPFSPISHVIQQGSFPWFRVCYRGSGFIGRGYGYQLGANAAHLFHTSL